MNKNNNIICEVEFIDQKKVKAVQKKLPDDSLINELSETFKSLSDFTRLKILLSLSEDELCVCDIAALTGVSVSAISHQLRLLKNNRLVSYRKERKMVYYSLDDEHISKIVNEATKHCLE
ncbi:ArsR/SmtB family transcription factor [Stygiobacter electus]|uniref:Metalloregulator ArsR/SmtB family transcription factor n=1 Tax=Stygiobacter electus TaxID=3032292 RepID=A0AAE3P2P0_9BACT|nr:metalloregulator ArsR/SmtB family transcription factor [Stygiobacter electus]MDF1613130.1 metalloregulator ArsR/SmtB family transcription factor [Stygiobacter electus]